MKLVFLFPLVVACSVQAGSQGETTTMSGQPITAAEVVGHWNGDWGDLYLRQETDGSIRGVYPHDTGTVTGRIVDGIFVGWWCEAPSRAPDKDAGDVEFRFTKTDSGLSLDGRWRYGAEADWKENWDLSWVETAVDQSLVSRFDDDSQFCTKP